MKVLKLGHVVLRVRNLDRSIRFYHDVLGLKEMARHGEAMVFFSIDEASHHDLALLAIGPQASSPSPNAVGLYHVAFKIGNDAQELKKAKEHLERHQIPIVGYADHTVSQSIYLLDPDGNELELYVDSDPSVWRENPQSVASVKPLSL